MTPWDQQLAWASGKDNVERSTPSLVDIYSTSLQELQALPGIGEAYTKKMLRATVQTEG